MKYIVFYATVIDDKDVDGVYVDFLFFGGKVNTSEEADDLARSIANDRGIPGVKIPKKFPMQSGQTYFDIKDVAYRFMRKMSYDMYDSEDIQSRTRKRRRKKK